MGSEYLVNYNIAANFSSETLQRFCCFPLCSLRRDGEAIVMQTVVYQRRRYQ